MERMDPHTRTVGLLVDPGLPEEQTTSFIDELRQELANTVDSDTMWHVEINTDALPLTPQGDIPLMSRAEDLLKNHQWDVVLYLTDLPRFQEENPSLCEVSQTKRAALISLPAMGMLRLKSRTIKLLVTLIRAFEEGIQNFPLVEAIQPTVKFKGARQATHHEREDTGSIVLPGRLGRLRLLSGMIRSNRPGSMLSALGGVITAGVALGSFGVFYSSVWTLADALHPARLALTTLIVVAALTAWLIIRNGLWNKRRDVLYTWQSGLDNATTIIMVTTSVLTMYALLALGLFVLGLTVIDSGHFQSELMHPVSLADYARTAWMAASVGTLAGALGTNFDSDEKIRAATYSKRQHERRQRTDSYNN